MAQNDVYEQLQVLLEKIQQLGEQLSGVKADDRVRRRLAGVTKLMQQINRKHKGAARKPRPSKKTTASADPALVELNERLTLVRDRVRGVARQGQAGFYLYGRAGTSKTFTVRTTLDDLGIPYQYENGHIAPMGLFELFEKNPDGIFVIDDVASIFKQIAAKNILLAALGSQPNGVREIKYRRQGKAVKVLFRGGVIVISNLELHGDELITAIKSRVQTLNYNPTDEQVEALMRSISTSGHESDTGKLTAKECLKVCEFLLERCRQLEVRPDVRMLVDKAFTDFALWKSGEAESHWQDLINSALEDQLVKLKHPVDLHVPTKMEEEAAELDLLEDITEKYTEHQQRVDAFVDATGRSTRTYQRRMKQLKAMKRLPKTP